MAASTIPNSGGPGSSIELSPVTIAVRDKVIEKFADQPLDAMNESVKQLLSREEDEQKRLGILAARVYILRQRISRIAEGDPERVVGSKLHVSCHADQRYLRRHPEDGRDATSRGATGKFFPQRQGRARRSVHWGSNVDQKRVKRHAGSAVCDLPEHARGEARVQAAHAFPSEYGLPAVEHTAVLACTRLVDLKVNTDHV